MDKYNILLSENERRLNGWILCQDHSHMGLSLSQGIIVDIFVCLLLPIIGEKKQMYKRDSSWHICLYIVANNWREETNV